MKNNNKGEYTNWNFIDGKVREYVFVDDDFAKQSFCSSNGTIFVNRDLVDKYFNLLGTEE